MIKSSKVKNEVFLVEMWPKGHPAEMRTWRVFSTYMGAHNWIVERVDALELLKADAKVTPMEVNGESTD